MPEAPKLTAEQHARLERQARRMLASAPLGTVIRQACGAARVGRRARGRALIALDCLIAKSAGTGAWNEVLARSIGMALYLNARLIDAAD